MLLTPFIIKDSLCAIKAGWGRDLSFTGDSKQYVDFYSLQSTREPLSRSVSISKGTVLYIVGQHDQLTQSSPQWMLLKQGQEGESGVKRGVGEMCPLPVALSLCYCRACSPWSLMPAAVFPKPCSRSAAVSGSRPQSRLPYWETVAWSFRHRWIPGLPL